MTTASSFIGAERAVLFMSAPQVVVIGQRIKASGSAGFDCTMVPF
jgi:hypothetical protein